MSNRNVYPDAESNITIAVHLELEEIPVKSGTIYCGNLSV